MTDDTVFYDLAGKIREIVGRESVADAFNRLRAENAAMREIVAAVATKDVLSHEGDAGDWISCPFCHGEDDWRNPEHPIDQHFIHEPTCVVMKARSLLKTEADDGAS